MALNLIDDIGLSKKKEETTLDLEDDISTPTKLNLTDDIGLFGDPAPQPFGEYIKSKWRTGHLPMIRGSYGREAMWGKMDTGEAIKQSQQATEKYREANLANFEEATWKTPIRKIVGETAELAPFMIGASKEALKQGVPAGVGAGTAAAIAGQIGPQALLPEEIVTVPGAFTAGMNIGGTYGVIKYSMDNEGGNLYLDMIEQGITPETARPLAMAGGLGIGVIETMQLKLLGKPFAGLIKKGAQTKIVKSVLSNALKKYANTYGTEVSEEMLQQVVDLSTRTLAGLLEKKTTPTREEWANELIETAKKSATGMLLMPLPGAAVEAATTKRPAPQKHTMPDGTIMPGPEHEEAIPRTERTTEPTVVEPVDLGKPKPIEGVAPEALPPELEAEEKALPGVEEVQPGEKPAPMEYPTEEEIKESGLTKEQVDEIYEREAAPAKPLTPMRSVLSTLSGASHYGDTLKNIAKKSKVSTKETEAMLKQLRSEGKASYDGKEQKWTIEEPIAPETLAPGVEPTMPIPTAKIRFTGKGLGGKNILGSEIKDWGARSIGSKIYTYTLDVPTGQEQQAIKQIRALGGKAIKLAEKPFEKVPGVQYSIEEGDYKEAMEGAGVSERRKVIPPETATSKMEWETVPAWQINLGRNIPGVFEREIGPKLQVSKRFKRFLGAYYPMLGSSGTIKMASKKGEVLTGIANEKTLNHEVGHFLDDVVGKYHIERRGDVRNELIAVTKHLHPFEEKYIPTGEISVKTGKPLLKQDSYTTYRRSRTELFAEYVSMYVTDPAMAKQLAPKFTEMVEKEIAKDKEFAYIIDKMRDFETTFKPIKEYVKTLRSIPEIPLNVQEWGTPGLLQRYLNIDLWTPFKSAMDKAGEKPILRETFRRGGMPEKVYNILRWRAKLASGQTQKITEEITDPISKLTEEDQQRVAESLQRFEIDEKDTPLSKLTQGARKELALWGLEAKKLGLLGDEEFWNNVGQYFPYFYDKREFDTNKAKFGYFPSREIRASFAGLKHRLTDEQLVRRYYEKTIGTFPQQKVKIDGIMANMTKKQTSDLAYKMREEMGLIKTAAYPIQKRLSQLIQMIYTVKAFNAISKMPGVTPETIMELQGGKLKPVYKETMSMELPKGFVKIPASRKFGDLAGKPVLEPLAKEVMRWGETSSEMGKAVDTFVTIFKNFKVPYDPNAVIRNMVSNMMMAYMNDIPIYNPAVTLQGAKSFITKDETYTALRDKGLYNFTYAAEELEKLSFKLQENPDNPVEKMMEWAIETFRIPGHLYGAVEDLSKTIIARYVMEKGGSTEQAVAKADETLFDYSDISLLTKKLRKGPFPFITWGSRILPLLTKIALQRPEKYMVILGTIASINAYNLFKAGRTREEVEKVKPDYIRGRPVIYLGTDKDGKHQWMDISYFMPWGGWLPIKDGKLAVPQILYIASPAMPIYNAFVTNHDPYYGEIAGASLPESQKRKTTLLYLLRSLGPRILTQSPSQIYKAWKGIPKPRPKSLGETVLGEFFAIKIRKDTSQYRGVLRGMKVKDYGKGMGKIQRDLNKGLINKEQAKKLRAELTQEFKRNMKRY